MNAKERISRSMKRTEKEALQCRASSLKRAMNNCIEWQDKPNIKPTRRFSLRVDQIKIQTSSNETSPCSSPLLAASSTYLLPEVSTSINYSCISPLPDTRRDSVDENFLNTLSLPAPKQFADPNSRRSSTVPDIVEENEDSSNGSDKTVKNDDDDGSKATGLTHLSDSMATTAPPSVTLEPDTSTKPPTKFDFNVTDARAYSDSGDYSGFQPTEVYERNLLRTLQEKTLNDKRSSKWSNELFANSLEIPVVAYDNFERPPDRDMATEVQEKSSSDEMPGEASDLLSTISNEEVCSVRSEILDRRPSELSQLNVADIIQDLSSDEIGHIDSPEMSETTDVLQGESLIDDISSVLGQDLLVALQDSTMTDDTTLCTLERDILIKKGSLKQKSMQMDFMQVKQFGFENRVFELDRLV